MKQVKGYTKEDYVKQCVEEGGTPVEYKDMAEASDALADVKFFRPQEVAAGIEINFENI